MSDLAATNCQSSCNTGCGCDGNGISSCLWIILLLLFCNGNNDGCGCDNNLWIIILLLFFCGGCGGNSFGCGC